MNTSNPGTISVRDGGAVISAQNQPLRVTLVAPLPPPAGGIARWTEALLDYVSEDPEIELIHVCSTQRMRSMVNLALSARIASGLVHGAGLFISFAGTLLTKGSQVVHMTTSGQFAFYRDIVFIAFARLAGRPTVLHIRGGRLPAAVSARRFEATLAKWACRMSGAVIVLDDASAQAVRTLAPNSLVFTVPNPAWKLAKAASATVQKRKAPTVLFVGWVIPAKGVRELVLACRDISDLPFRLEMYGIVKDEMRQELMEIAAVRDGGDWLDIFGEAPATEIAAAISGAAMLVLPSYTEGCPNVVLEAMMLGKAVIATPVGAIPELLSLGSEPCGIGVPAGDTDALRAAVVSLLASPSWAEELGARGRQRVALRFSPEVIYPQYRSIWRRCAEAEER